MSVYLDRKYIQLISHRFADFHWKSPNLANCRDTVFCGDSKKKSKKRGYFYLRDNKWEFFCHNCGTHYSIPGLLKRLDLQLFQEYRLESLDNTKIDTPKFGGRVAEKFDHGVYYDRLKELPKIIELPKTHKARLYIEERQIPTHYLSVMRWSDEFMKWSNMLVHKFTDKALLFDEGRIVIPYFSSDKQFFAYTARSIDPGQEKRYILIILNHRFPLAFGLDRWQEPKYAVEGPIDSMFLSDCIALSGSNLTVLTKVHKDIIITLDNEPRSKQTYNRLNAAIDLGHRICVWPPYVEYKDINKMVMSGWTPEYIKEIIDANVFQGFEAKVKLEEWSIN